MKDIYSYIPLVKDATDYFVKKYRVSYEEGLSLGLEVLIVCLMLDNQFIKNHFSGYYLIKLEELFKNHKKIKVLPYINELNEVEVIINYLYNEKHFPKYRIADILGLDHFGLGTTCLDNIIDTVDLKKNL